MAQLRALAALVGSRQLLTPASDGPTPSSGFCSCAHITYSHRDINTHNLNKIQFLMSLFSIGICVCENKECEDLIVSGS